VVHQFLDLVLHPDAVHIREDAKEDRVLPGLAIAAEKFVDSAQPFRVSDVVANEIASAHIRS
jgi:hypothetical protein